MWEIASGEPGIRGDDVLDADPITRALADDVRRAEQVEGRFDALNELPRAGVDVIAE